jgi:hypothetical protein
MAGLKTKKVTQILEVYGPLRGGNSRTKGQIATSPCDFVKFPYANSQTFN